MLQTVRAEKVDWVICQVSMLPSWVMVVKLSKKKCIFCKFLLQSFRKWYCLVSICSDSPQFGIP